MISIITINSTLYSWFFSTLIYLSFSESGGYNKAKPCQIQGQDEQAAANLRVQQYALSRNLEITQINGQRKLHPKVRGPQPSPMAEVFVGKLPRDVYEDVIYPLFNAVGEIYELRLMMHFSGMNRGFCFVLFNSVQDAKRAISMLNNYEIVAGKQIGVVASLNNTKLSLWKLPTDISTEEIVKVCIFFNAINLLMLLPKINVFFFFFFNGFRKSTTSPRR